MARRYSDAGPLRPPIELDIDERTFRFHAKCLTAWHQEPIDPTPADEGPSLGLQRRRINAMIARVQEALAQ